MNGKEYEMKIRMQREQYEALLRLLSQLPGKTELQNNYYYDTYDQYYRKQNVTLRVREKNGRLKGTVKRHLPGGYGSREEDFFVDSVPSMMLFEGTPVSLKGCLQTKRTTIVLSEAMLLMLDENVYLHARDYELELECPQSLLPQASGILLLLQKLLRLDRMQIPLSKSERFFRRLDALNQPKPML